MRPFSASSGATGTADGVSSEALKMQSLGQALEQPDFGLDPCPSQEVGAEGVGALGGMRRSIDVSQLERVYQVGNPRSASTYQWYLLCTVLRVALVNQAAVACDADEAQRLPPNARAVRLHKLHPGVYQVPNLSNWPYNGSAVAPNTDAVFVSLGADESDPVRRRKLDNGLTTA